MTGALEMVALTTSRIYSKDIQILTNYVMKLAKNLNFYANSLVVKHSKERSKL